MFQSVAWLLPVSSYSTGGIGVPGGRQVFTKSEVQRPVSAAGVLFLTPGFGAGEDVETECVSTGDVLLYVQYQTCVFDGNLIDNRSAV